MAIKRKIKVINGQTSFIDDHHMRVIDKQGNYVTLGFDQCIIAAGSSPISPPYLPEDHRIINSTGALKLDTLPRKILVIGGGIIGLEMATIYRAFGSEVSIVERQDRLISQVDPDIVKPLYTRIKKQYANIWLNTRVTQVESKKYGLQVTINRKNECSRHTYDQILVSIGRTPNSSLIEVEKAGILIDHRGFILVDRQQRTNISHIFAVGDIAGPPMLAHKAIHEGKVAAEVCAGLSSEFDTKIIPSVSYTDPEIAWVGMTETQAKLTDKKIGKGIFPWSASGKSLSLNRNERLTKLIFDTKNNRVIGGSIVGPNAGDLIAEVALAIETHCDASDISLTVHPHPTLSETVSMAAEVFEGSITDLYMPK